MIRPVSKERAGGTLKGAYAPALEVGVAPPKLHGKEKLRIRVPRDKRAGDYMKLALHGRNVKIRIPDNFDHRQSDKFTWTYPGDVDQVIASTLQYIPGHEIILSKPITWGSVSFSYRSSGQPDLGAQMGKLMQEAEELLLSAAITEECNAVLGIHFNITNDHVGDCTRVVVTACGTPCLIVTAGELPTVIPEAVMLPLYEDGTAVSL